MTPQGVAFIEYTFSSGTVWPQIRRAQLTSNYTGVQTDTLVQAGPSLSYTGPRWADFNDMQAVPSGCGFVSLHTLVSDGEANDVRDVWLFENPMNCNSAEMTGDGIIDEDDLLFFSNEYATGSRRVDMDRSRGIDATDYALFMQAYAAR